MGSPGQGDGVKLPNSFHDAFLVEVQLNLPAQTVEMVFDFWVGSTDAPAGPEREAMRRGVLRLAGVSAVVIEPPHPDCKFTSANGAKVDGGFGGYPGDPAPPDDGLVRLWFYVNTWNSRMMFTAKSFALSWVT